jgi:integrase
VIDPDDLLFQTIAPEKMTFASFVNEWREKYAIKHLAEKTLYSYEINLKNRVIPALGHLRIDQITTFHIVNFIDSLTKKGARQGFRKGDLSTGTIEMHHRVIKNVFTRAVELKIIKQNPVSDVKKPKVKHKEIMPYNEDEVQDLLQALQNQPIHWRVMVILALSTGLRRGELLGLEWKHINWDTGVIDVVQSVSMSPAGIAHVKVPKTKNSKRKVALNVSMLEEMRKYFLFKSEERANVGDRWQGGEYSFMFCHPEGQAFHQERPYLWFRNFLQKNKLRYIHSIHYVTLVLPYLLTKAFTLK